MKQLSRWLKRYTLAAMTVLPFPSIVLAAESALAAEVNSSERLKALTILDADTVDNVGTWQLLNPKLRAMRKEVIPPLTIRTRIEDAFERYRQHHPELSGAEADQAFLEVLAVLRERGLIIVNEDSLISHGDSEGGFDPGAK